MKWERDWNGAFEKVYENQKRQYEKLHVDPPRESREYFGAVAFILGLEVDEMHRLQSEDPKEFMLTEEIAFGLIEKNAPVEDSYWEEAKRIRQKIIEAEMKLQDKISKYHNSSRPRAIYPKEPKPPKVFKNTYKPKHKGKGSMHTPYFEALIKSSVANKKAREFRLTVTDEAAEKAFNIEPRTPLDE